jgi:hypothetical protein
MTPDVFFLILRRYIEPRTVKLMTLVVGGIKFPPDSGGIQGGFRGVKGLPD